MGHPSKHNYLILNRQRKYSINKEGLQKFVSNLVPVLGIEDPFSVVLVSDSSMRRYNRDYRGLDKPTDVLSFQGDDGYLGDILISSETAYNQARKSEKLSFEANIHRLLLHGMLHLMGYDHEIDDGEMRALERRLRRKFQC